MSDEKVISPGRTEHILTVTVGDYYHAGPLQGAIRRKHWIRFESRLERSLDQILELLQRHGATATFFFLGCVAERNPELVGRIAGAGHEVAASSFWPKAIQTTLPDEFRDEVRRSREAIEAAGAPRVTGFRASHGWLAEGDLWALDVLAEEGFAYDSSLNPMLRRFARHPNRSQPHFHQHSTQPGGVWEFPIATVRLLGLGLPVSGGNYVRQLPHALLSRFVARLDRRSVWPLVFYFMPWEFDRDQPHFRTISRLEQVRMYRNLGKTRWVFEEHLKNYRFRSVAEHLTRLAAPSGAPDRASSEQQGKTTTPTLVASGRLPAVPAHCEPAVRDETAVTLVVPLYNEEENVGYLHRTLRDFRRTLAQRYRVHVVLVDDGSTDRTWDELQAVFEAEPDCRLLRQPRNGGVAAAIMAGIASAPTEIVCSIDCDCSYDPHELAAMLPLIADADLVTASPYHPDGQVLNVPGWRLLLSKSLSRMYSAVLGGRIHTYTSCCRVYRKSVFEKLPLKHGGFLGVAEMLVGAKQRGARIVEHPATLESRLFGESKIKIVRTIGGHLGLLGGLIAQRLTARASPIPTSQAAGRRERP